MNATALVGFVPDAAAGVSIVNRPPGRRQTGRSKLGDVSTSAGAEFDCPHTSTT
jgi:hypothetical protein